ncbi:MAG TPA: EAL domain-containing protein [Candidatus Limnocylindrales bacterium]|nr:EAL domain-containing protein [Candidatus Limnocylindrales bacterium]
MATIYRVLIADDDASMRAFLEAALQREGFETVLATNGRDALTRIEQEAFDVVLLDVDMPFLDGLRTLRQIRAAERFKTLPVILVTGSIDEAERIRGLELGANDYLGKPVRIRELTARVRAQLRERTAWTSELERGRAARRNLNTALEGLVESSSLLELAGDLARRLPNALGVDGAAILHFGSDAVRSIAASGVLSGRFPAGRGVEELLGREIALRSTSGAWTESTTARPVADGWLVDVAFVPFRLAASGAPLGCFVYALRPDSRTVPLSHRLPDLIDATGQIVVVLRPAVERAETADAAITRIRSVIDERAYSMVFQPIVRLDSRRLVAVEALTRFSDGTSPQLVFEEAAALGLGGALQRATVAAAIEGAASLDPAVELNVNLSGDAIQHETSFQELFTSSGRTIVVELTEHERIDDYDAVRSALANLGPTVRLAIDDAGSGFASLRHIFALKPAYVKLDIEWVRHIDEDPIRRALVTGLVHFAAETGCELIAEGIESEAELEALRNLGVGLGQGYLLGRPAAL